VVLTVFANGGRAKPLVIFRGKRLGKVKAPDGVEVLMHPKAWNSDDGIKVWLSRCLLPYVKELRKVETTPLLLTMDLFRPHLSEELNKELKKHVIVPCIIPGGITSIVQPLDVSINKASRNASAAAGLIGWSRPTARRIQRAAKCVAPRRISF
jgi:hypothetical protein